MIWVYFVVTQTSKAGTLTVNWIDSNEYRRIYTHKWQREISAIDNERTNVDRQINDSDWAYRCSVPIRLARSLLFRLTEHLFFFAQCNDATTPNLSNHFVFCGFTFRQKLLQMIFCPVFSFVRSHKHIDVVLSSTTRTALDAWLRLYANRTGETLRHPWQQHFSLKHVLW